MFRLQSDVTFDFTCDRPNSFYYGKKERHMKIRPGEHLGILPLTLQKVKPF